MLRIPSLVVAGLALCLAAGTASAQTPPAAPVPAAPAPAAPAAPAPAGKAMAKPRSAQSIACSGKADQQNLHGKPRKTFMSQCKHAKA